MPKGFYEGGRKRLANATQFHILLCQEDRLRLAKLTHALKLSASDVVRDLIRKAKP